MVLSKFFFDIGQVLIDLFLVKLVLLAVLGAKFCTVTGNASASDEVKMAGHLCGSPEDFPDGP